MSYLLIHYPKCSTCKKALKYLKEKGVVVEERHIVEETPTKEELSLWIDQSGLPFKKFFNTSGMLYREMGLKDKVNTFTKEEAVELLTSNGMLIKRPLLIHDDKVVVGFKAEAYDALV